MSEVKAEVKKLEYRLIPVNLIEREWVNPREAGGEIKDLVESVRIHGILEPIIVSHTGKEDCFSLVAGSRRLAAFKVLIDQGVFKKEAGIPAVVGAFNKNEATEVTVVENLIRKNLSQFEEAIAFDVYLKENGDDSLTVLSERTGASPSYIRRRVAVLKLPERARQLPMEY